MKVGDKVRHINCGCEKNNKIGVIIQMKYKLAIVVFSKYYPRGVGIPTRLLELYEENK